MGRCHFAVTLAFVLLCMGPGISIAQEQQQEGYRPARLIDRPEPRYPEAIRLVEGWATISTVVTTEGNPVESVVLSSSGPPAFEREALRVASGSKYEPATMDGSPVVSHATVQYRFRLPGSLNSAGRDFGVDFQAFRRYAAEGDRPRAEQALSRMQSQRDKNLYELALLNLANFQLAVLDGDTHSQMRNLEDALSMQPLESERRVAMLPEELTRQARRSLLFLYLENNRFAEAQTVYREMENDGDTDGAAEYQEAMEWLQDMKTREGYYTTPAQINASGYWYTTLFRTGFGIASRSGVIESGELRCRAGRYVVPLADEMEYEMPEGAGSCTLIVSGEPGIQFELMQF